MTHLVLILAAALGAGEVEQAGVRVRTEVVSNRYTWHVTNVGVAPIRRIRIPVHNMYAPVAPTGWSTDLPKKGRHFEAWTDDPVNAIAPGRTGVLSATVSVKEARLGGVTLEVDTEAGATVRVDGVWSATPVSRGHAYLVAAMVAAIALLQWMIARRSVTPVQSTGSASCSAVG